MEAVIIKAAAVHADLVNIFTRLDVSMEDAELLAEVLVRTEQWGVKSHGLLRVKPYVACLISKGIIAGAAFSVLQRKGAWAQASANGGLGIPASVKATRLAMQLAQESVVGMVNVNMSHHNGAEGYYARMCAENGMIGIVMSTGNPIMAVSGSNKPTIGNNPLAYGVPAGKYGEIVMDIAMSNVSDGKVQQAKALGQQLPLGCFLGADGQPSTDPDDYLNGGVLLPFGAHKGYGLAVMVECMAGILSAAALTHDINSWNREEGKCGNTGHLFIAIDIQQIMPLQDYTNQVEKMIAEFKQSQRLPGVSEIFYPGEIERKRYQRHPNTVDIYPTTINSLRQAAELAGVTCESF